MPLLRRHRPSGGNEATSRFTTADIAIPNVLDENLDELFPWRDPEGQDLEDDIEDQIVGGYLESGEHPTNKEQLGISNDEVMDDAIEDDEVDEQDAEEVGEEEDEEPTPKSRSRGGQAARGEQAPKGKRIARTKPICYSIHGIYLTKSTAQSLEDMRMECEMSSELEFRVSEVNERPWDCPKGYICLYEVFFAYCLLWFPLSYMYVKYFVDRDITFMQISTAGICNMVGLTTLGVECGLKVILEAFEEMSLINKGSKPCRFYVSMKPGYKLITHFKSKVYCWDEKYLFVKISAASIFDVSGSYRRAWNRTMGRCSD